MNVRRDDGEPISRGQLDRRGAEIEALRDSLFVAAVFGGMILINGIVAILLIGWLEDVHAALLGILPVEAGGQPSQVLEPGSPRSAGSGR